MGWREWVVRRAFPDVAAAIREATIAETLAEEDWGWRALTAQGAKDLPFQAWLEQLNDAVEAYRVNPLAYRIVELMVDHVLGKEVAVRCANSEWQGWVDRFWHDPLNRMPSRVHELLTELVLTGDLFVTFHPDPYSDMVYVRPIPSSLIDQMETNPEDIEDELRYHQLPQSVLGQRAGWEGVWWDRERMRHYAINRLVGATRGQGDLTPILPWLRRYKDWLTDRVRINRFKGAFLWWVKLRTQDPRVIQQKRAEYAVAPNPGSILVTNESEEWTAIQPNIDARAVEPDGKALRLMVAAGAGLPLHFLAEGEGTNRATAQEMGGPTLRHFERRQRYFAWVLKDIIEHAARLSGRFVDSGLDVSIEFEPLTVEDNLKLAQAAQAIVAALKEARELGWVDDETAADLFRRFAGEPAFAGRRK